jgi:hypothetical protein
VPVNWLKIWQAVRSVPAEAVTVVVELVKRIATSEDPKSTARRLLEEEARLRAFDRSMKEISRRVR